jgi:fucose 4-O-acetylase-like acetyltransferase
MNRDRSIDLGKGLAILFVYLGHSIIYHPIRLIDVSPSLSVLEHLILSFNMPMFFIISGFLFSKTKKSTAELYKGKTLRILIPYITTMFVIIGMKLILPKEMSYNQAVGGGITSLLKNAFLYGGDRWFVYTLFIIFLLLIPVRKWLKNKWVSFVFIGVLIGVYFLDFLPKIFALNKVFHFMVFFVVGYMLDEYYPAIKAWSLKYWWLIYIVFVLANLVFIETFRQVPFVFRFVLPFTGTLAMMTMAFQLEKVIEKSKVAQYIEYCGKYSLQFYLFTFCYPIIRTVIVSVLHITNPFVILTSVFVLQLIAITVIVEITRRIKWLKIPCGY